MPTDERDTLVRLHSALQAHSNELAIHATLTRDLAVAIGIKMHALARKSMRCAPAASFTTLG